MFSAIVPAYNEARVIGRCLETLSAAAVKLGGDIVVVCNGCSDDTASVASHYPRVRVLVTDIPSKVQALNLGESEVSSFPRLYFDADLQMTTDAIVALVERMSCTSALLVAPKMTMDLSRCSWLSRQYHQFWSALPAYAKRMGGVYGLTEQGRGYFDQFPEVTGDDAYVRSLFSADQVDIPADIEFLCEPPTNLRDLLQVRTRIVRGGNQLEAQYGASPEVPTNGLGDVIARVARHPSELLAAACFVSVTLWVKYRVNRQRGRGHALTWERDHSSRVSG